VEYSSCVREGEAPSSVSRKDGDDIVQVILGRGWRRGFNSLPRHKRSDVQGVLQLLAKREELKTAALCEHQRVSRGAACERSERLAKSDL